jgi:hypothetical protein
LDKRNKRHALAGKVLYSLIMQLLAASPDLNHKTLNRISVAIRHPLGRTDRIALN